MAVTINSNGTITGIAAGGLPDGVVDTDTLAADAVTAAKVADNAVTTAKINADAVTAAKVADNAVTTAKINADAVTAAKIADAVVNSEHLVNGGVDDAHLATGITSSKLSGALPAISGASLTGISTSIFAGHTTRNLTAAAGTQAITGVGFQPKAIYFSGGQTGTQQISWGWSVDLSTDFHFCIADDHDTTSDTMQVFYTGGVDQSISFRTALGVNQSAKVTTWGTDGFTLTWTKAGSPSGTMQISYLCIG